MITTTVLDYPDTTFFHNLKVMNPISCWATIFPPHNCENNQMVADGDILKFIQKPIGEYLHWQTVRYSVTNCITIKTKLRQESPNGPLLSPLGPLNVSIDNKYAFINDQTIVWTVPPHPPKSCFETDLIAQGDGNMTQLDEHTGRILDHTQQLEIIINTTEINTICDKSLMFYAVKGLPNTYVSFTRLNATKRLRPTLPPRRPSRAIRKVGAGSYSGSLRPSLQSNLCVNAIDGNILLLTCRTLYDEQSMNEDSGQDFSVRSNGQIELTNTSLCIDLAGHRNLLKLNPCDRDCTADPLLDNALGDTRTCVGTTRWLVNKTRTANAYTEASFRLHTRVDGNTLCIRAMDADQTVERPHTGIINILPCREGNLRDYWFFQPNIYEQRIDPDSRVPFSSTAAAPVDSRADSEKEAEKEQTSSLSSGGEEENIPFLPKGGEEEGVDEQEKGKSSLPVDEHEKGKSPLPVDEQEKRKSSPPNEEEEKRSSLLPPQQDVQEEEKDSSLLPPQQDVQDNETDSSLLPPQQEVQEEEKDSSLLPPQRDESDESSTQSPPEEEMNPLLPPLSPSFTLPPDHSTSGMSPSSPTITLPTLSTSVAPTHMHTSTTAVPVPVRTTALHAPVPPTTAPTAPAPVMPSNTTSSALSTSVKPTSIVKPTAPLFRASSTIAPTPVSPPLSPKTTVNPPSTTTSAPPSSPTTTKRAESRSNSSLASNKKWDDLDNLPDYDSIQVERDEYDRDINGTDGKPFIQRELSSNRLALDSSGAPFMTGADQRIQTDLYRKHWEQEESTAPSIEAHQLERSVLEGSEREKKRARLRARAVQIEEFNLLLHAQDQFLQGQITDHENVLANEIRDSYCTILDMKKFQSILLASMDPLLTAKSLGLDSCNAIVGQGESLILQVCLTVAVEVTAKQTSCGSEPVAYIGNDTYGLSPSGYSLIPFLPCIHRHSYVTLNSRPHRYVNNKWVEQEPVIHLNNLDLVAKFHEVFLNMPNLTDHHPTMTHNLWMASSLRLKKPVFSTISHPGSVTSSILLSELFPF